jgi:CHAT domain-containing protein/tetratricopeptide (TPR) repeat protein
VLDEHERADAIRPETPGLVFVMCDLCGAAVSVNDALLLVRSTTVAPVVAVLSWEQLQEPGAVLGDLLREVGAELPGEPLLAPRVLLSLLLTRDVDADALDPGRAADEVRAEHGAELGDLYVHFLSLAVDQHADAEVKRGLEALWEVPVEQLPGWLDDHPQLTGPTSLALLDQISGRANAAGDAAAAGVLGRLREMLGAVAAGTPAADAVAAYETSMVEHFDLYGRPDFDRLWGLADAPDTEQAIFALREILAHFPVIDSTGVRRMAAARLAARLLESRPTPGAVEEAITLLEDVRGSTSELDSVWAAATGNLAAAVADRPGSDIMDNWRLSVALLREALTAAADERTMAINETNLGLALTNRPGGASSAELDEAIKWLASGLARRSPEASLEDWSYSKINLGHALRRRNGPGDLDHAIGQYRDARDRLGDTPLTRLLLYAECNLASALSAADSSTYVEALAVAGAAANRAAQFDDAFVLGWALRVQGDSHAALNGPQSPAAVAAWQHSVDVLDVNIHPGQLLDNAGRLCDALGAAEAWEPLAALYERMLAAFDALFSAQATNDARRHVLTSNPRLARWAAYALARTGHTLAAIEALERARARELDVSARRDTADLVAVGCRDPGLVDRYRNALTAYRAATAQLQPQTVPTDTATSGDPAVAAAATLHSVIDEIRAIPGLERFLMTPTAAESLVAAGVSQALYIASAPAGTFVLRVAAERPDAAPRYDAVHVDVTSRDVAHMLLFDEDNGEPGLLLAQMLDAIPEAVERALTQIQRRFAPVVAAVAELAAEAAPNPLVLVPTGLVGLVPLHSLPITADGTTLDDVAEIHLAPSLAVYAASRRRAARPIPRVLVGIADTDPDQPLPGSRGELAVIAAQPGWASVTVAVGAEATLDWLASYAPNASHLHLACHGSNDFADPDGSHLILGRGTRLTVPALIHGIPLRARVAVASACQSAHFDTAVVPDEQIGLATGLLQAGAACAVVSLWPVSDEAAALLMTRFYELLSASGERQPHEQAPQTALRQARLWLRALTEASRAGYLDEHPILASALRARGFPAAATRRGSHGPYDTIQDWGAFVAYGC